MKKWVLVLSLLLSLDSLACAQPAKIKVLVVEIDPILKSQDNKKADGYSHNWWTYLASIDWVDTLEIQPMDDLVIGHSQCLHITGIFRSTKKADISDDVILTSSNPKVIRIVGQSLALCQ